MKIIYKKFSFSFLFVLYIILLLFSGYIKRAFLLFITLFFHELGHLFIILIFKIKVTSFNMYPWGSIIKLDKQIDYPIIKELLLASFGIINQLVLLLVSFILLRINILNISDYYQLVSINKIIILFNLLPIIPLDGYHIMLSLLSIFICFKKSYYILYFISTITIISFIYFTFNNALSNLIIYCILVLCTFKDIFNLKYRYHCFLLEKYLYKTKYTRKVTIDNKDNFYLNRYHYLLISNKILNECEFLAVLFDNKQ